MVAFGHYRHGIIGKVAPQNCAQPLELGTLTRLATGFSRIGKCLAAIAGQRKADCRMRHRQPFQNIAHRRGFGAVGFQEFEPRRCSKK